MGKVILQDFKTFWNGSALGETLWVQHRVEVEQREKDLGGFNL